MYIGHATLPNSSPSGATGVFVHVLSDTFHPANPRQMRLWQLAGIKRVFDTVFYTHSAPLVLRSSQISIFLHIAQHTKLTPMG